MWSYYGRKKKIIKKYPKPLHEVIIEPFAGSASYAYEYWYKNVVIIDSFDKVIAIWRYLQNASPNDILSLPDVANGEFIGDKHKQLCDEERWLIGFCINNGSAIPKHTAGRMNFNSWHRDKVRIANDLYKIRHWVFFCRDYDFFSNPHATWFIDPPYQFGGKSYSKSNVNLDYQSLSNWCETRCGQVIVCENTKASWMDFEPLVELSGQRHKTTEAMWYKE